MAQNSAFLRRCSVYGPFFTDFFSDWNLVSWHADPVLYNHLLARPWDSSHPVPTGRRSNALSLQSRLHLIPHSQQADWPRCAYRVASMVTEPRVPWFLFLGQRQEFVLPPPLPARELRDRIRDAVMGIDEDICCHSVGWYCIQMGRVLRHRWKPHLWGPMNKNLNVGPLLWSSSFSVCNPNKKLQAFYTVYIRPSWRWLVPVGAQSKPRAKSYLNIHPSSLCTGCRSFLIYVIPP